MDWWEEYRKQFPVANECVYLDNAYDCGGSIIGEKAAKKYFSDWANGARRNERGGPGREILFRTLDETRILLNELVGGISPEQIAFTRNTNEGINAILQGFKFEPKDNIITSAQEHPSVLMPCLNVAKTRGVEVRIVPARSDGKVLIEELTSKVDKHTKMILVSHVQSATGYCIDLQALGLWCKKNNIFLIVDAIQSLGLKPFFSEKWGLSAVSAASYKGLCGVNSTAFTYYHPDLLKNIWPTYVAANPFIEMEESEQFSLFCKDDTKARKMENSSLDNLGIYVLHDAVKEILTIGTEKIGYHITSLFEQLHDGLSSLGYPVITPRKTKEHCGILSVKAANIEEMYHFFRQKNICLSISADKFIRFSLGAFNNQQDILILLTAAEEYAQTRARI